MLLKYQLPGTNDMEELVSLENNEDLDNFKVSLLIKQDNLREAMKLGRPMCTGNTDNQNFKWSRSLFCSAVPSCCFVLLYMGNILEIYLEHNGGLPKHSSPSAFPFMSQANRLNNFLLCQVLAWRGILHDRVGPVRGHITESIQTLFECSRLCGTGMCCKHGRPGSCNMSRP